MKMTLFETIKNPGKRLNQLYRNEKISKSLKKYNNIHKGERRVRVNEYGQFSHFIYLPIRK